MSRSARRWEETSQPVGSGGSLGGVAGVGSNLNDFGNGNAGLPSSPTQPQTALRTPEAKTKSTTKRNAVGMELERRVANSPVLTHIDVVVTIDSSLAEHKDEIAAAANAMVPIDSGARDSIGRVVVQVAPMASIERDEEGKPLPAAPIEDAPVPNPMIEMALEYGIEALAALAFLFVLLRSLKGVRFHDHGGRGERDPEGARRREGHGRRRRRLDRHDRRR